MKPRVDAPIVILQAGASFAVAAGLLAYVLGHRPRAILHRALIAMLWAILLWNAGTLLRLAGDGTISGVAFRIQYLGVYTMPPLFLFLAARCARLTSAEERPGALLPALLVPALLAYMALLSNPYHHLFATRPFSEAAVLAPSQWGGPLFWLAAGWSYFCVQVGVAICLVAAWRTPDPLERKRHLILAAAASTPLAANAVFMAGLVPVTVTPAALGLTGLLMVAAVLRYRLLESAPLPAREVIAHLREGLLLCDADGRVQDANPAAEALLGGGLETLRRTTLAQIADRLDPSGELTSALANCPRPALAVHDVDSVVVVHDIDAVHSDGERAIEVSSGWMHGRDGSTVGRFLVFNDRTEQRRHERLRHQSERLASVAALAAGVAHEINNPLAYVRANLVELSRIAEAAGEWAEQCESKKADALAEMCELVDESLEGVSRIASIVESTRRLAKEPGDRRDRVDLNAVAREALQFASFHEIDGATVETALSPELPELDASPERLAQLVLNLLINARQALASRAGGRILVETVADDEFVELRVHDNGRGVPSDLRERIFEPFFTTREPDQGTGLGLAIAYDVAYAHGGHIDVIDSQLGGACFRLRLPRARCDDPATAPAPTASSS